MRKRLMQVGQLLVIRTPLVVQWCPYCVITARLSQLVEKVNVKRQETCQDSKKVLRVRGRLVAEEETERWPTVKNTLD